ncbi:MAG: hypothetical protein Q7U08_06980 [Flavobacteriaceae bacterium]|nr:hypothetical protein [Flavobacteriaceae bacterium]
MKKLLLIGLSLLLSNCVTTKIQSNKAYSFNEKISKLYILVRGNDDSRSFYTSFTNDFEKTLNEKGIKYQKYYYDPLSLETEKDIQTKINYFEPNLIMIVNQTESRNTVNQNAFSFGSNSTNTGGTFEVKLFKPNSDNPVWRAKLQADGQFGLSTSAEKASQK